MTKLLIDKNESNDPSSTHECIARFVKSVKPQVLPQPPTTTTDDTSISAVSQSQDTTEMTDLTEAPALKLSCQLNQDHDQGHKWKPKWMSLLNYFSVQQKILQITGPYSNQTNITFKEI